MVENVISVGLDFGSKLSHFGCNILFIFFVLKASLTVNVVTVMDMLKHANQEQEFVSAAEITLQEVIVTAV